MFEINAEWFSNAWVLLGVCGFVMAIAPTITSYYTKTTTTMEKMFEISPNNMIVINIASRISITIFAPLISYYCRYSHRPKWIGFGIFIFTASCILFGLPYFIYGPGQLSLQAMSEFGENYYDNATKIYSKLLCIRAPMNDTRMCESIIQADASTSLVLLLFFTQFVTGIASSIHSTMISLYIDDNVHKSRTAIIYSILQGARSLGPFAGTLLAFWTLSIYVTPSLTPSIDNTDPRWLGAYWMGWYFIAGVIPIFGIIMMMMPKKFPNIENENQSQAENIQSVTSFKDMRQSIKKILCNKLFMCNAISTIFHGLGNSPYSTSATKYVEVQYRVSSSAASLWIGLISLGASGISSIGYSLILSIFKFNGRKISYWNMFVGITGIIGTIGYSYLGCPENENLFVNNIVTNTSIKTCNSDCNCDFVPYSPVLGEDGNTYISPCHAGCTDQYTMMENKTTIFFNCACILTKSNSSEILEKFNTSEIQAFDSILLKNIDSSNPNITREYKAIPGLAPIDCSNTLQLFFVVLLILKVLESTAKTNNFLLTSRCVGPEEKSTSFGIDVMLKGLFSDMMGQFIFPWITESFCFVKNKTCDGHSGNCWEYEVENYRIYQNLACIGFLVLGVFFDGLCAYYAGDLQVCDLEKKTTENNDTENADNDETDIMENNDNNKSTESLSSITTAQTTTTTTSAQM